MGVHADIFRELHNDWKGNGALDKLAVGGFHLMEIPESDGKGPKRPFVRLFQEEGGDVKRTSGTPGIETMLFTFEAEAETFADIDELTDLIVKQFDRAEFSADGTKILLLDRRAPAFIELVDQEIWRATIPYTLAVNTRLPIRPAV